MSVILRILVSTIGALEAAGTVRAAVSGPGAGADLADEARAPALLFPCNSHSHARSRAVRFFIVAIYCT